MATKVLDIDVADIAEPIMGLDDYQEALMLFRYRGRPVGKAILPVINGCLSSTDVYDCLHNPEIWPLWEQKVHDYLEWDENVHSHFSLPQATVVVCTRNRPHDLKRCLDAFMALPDYGQEFIVVDNCPSDDASYQVAANYRDRVRYVREDCPGLNNARNRALREARHEIVAFNDDDAVPDSHWLSALLENFAEPTVLCVTGLTMPLELETTAQEWFEKYSPFGRGFYRRLFYGTPALAFKAGHVGAGANMAVRKSILEKIGPFDESLDAGTPTLSGGDTEMFARILSAGYHIVYDPAALNWHRHRRTWPELRQTAYGYGVGTYAVWTRRFVIDHQPGVLQAAWQHGLYYQLPLLARSLLRRPNHMPLDLVLAEMVGCLVGTYAYFVSRSGNQHSRKTPAS
jgi:GT2 family glycosyltransferase